MSGAAAILAGGLALAAPPGTFAPAAAAAVLTSADEHYARRDGGRQGALASSAEIDLAIEGYEQAARDPADAQARWKLARALYFRARYTGLAPPQASAMLQRARNASDEAVAILARRARARGRGPVEPADPAEAARALAGDPDAAPAFFWAAVSWGEWALARGKLAAAKTGAAARIRDDSRVVIALDPRFEEGGGYRILGRLHDQAPRVPFLTGWVSRSDALRWLREAVRVAPRNLVNRHFLAEALAKGNAAERQEAIAIERGVVEDQPSPDHVVEELAIQEHAKRNLEGWEK